MKKVRIVLTPKDLEGEYENGYDCPVYRSLSRQFKGANIIVWPWSVTINGRTFDTGRKIEGSVIGPMQKAGKLRHIYLDMPDDVVALMK